MKDSVSLAVGKGLLSLRYSQMVFEYGVRISVESLAKLLHSIAD